MIEETNGANFSLELIPNRTIEVFSEIFKRRIRPFSILRTDEYPSYPSAAINAQLIHQVVFHSEGFTNELGYNTKKIENLWMHLKTAYRSRYEILHENFEEFIFEFTFKEKLKKTFTNENATFYYDQLINKLI